VLRATRSVASTPAATAAFAAQLGAEVGEVESGHCASLDEPGALAECLDACFTRAARPPATHQSA
jgi:hypothetical protein